MALILVMALKILGALLLVLAPGLLASRLLHLAKNRLQLLPITFGVSLIFLTFIDLPLVCLHLNIFWLLVSWCVLTAVLAFVAWRKGEIQALWLRCIEWLALLKAGDKDTILDAVCCALLLLVAVCLFTGPGYIGGEEEIEMIITRKILENPYWTFDNSGHVPNLVPTYLLTPLYLLRALLSYTTGIDPVVMQYRLGFIPCVMAILSCASIVQVLTGSVRVGQSTVVLGALCTLFSPFDTIRYSPYILPGWQMSPNLPPPNAFYRATCSVQIATPVCILAMLLTVTEKKRWGYYAALFLCMLFTTIQIHATAAVYIMELLGFYMVACGITAIAKKFGDPEANSSLRRSMIMVFAAAALLLTYKQIFNVVHQDIESLEIHQRQFIWSDLMNCLHSWKKIVYQFPQSVYRFDYFKYRGARYDSLWGELKTLMSAPMMLFSFACSYIYLLFRRHPAPIFLFLVLIGFTIILRMPLFGILALLLNASVFNDIHEHLTFFCYITLFLTAIITSDLISKWLVMTGRNSYAAVGALFIAGVLSYYYVAPIAQNLQVILNCNSNFDAVLRCFYIGTALVISVVLLLGKQPLHWDFSSYKPLPALLLTLAFILPIAVRNYGEKSSSMISALPKNVRKLRHILSSPYAQYTQNIWGYSKLDQPFYDCLQFVRKSIPPQHIFAADPWLIRTIPLLTNEYIVHSGVPYDFVEQYFVRYYKPYVKQDEPGKPVAYCLTPGGKNQGYVGSDPFFQTEGRLSEHALVEDAKFVKDFHVDYVLFTPKFHEGTDELFQAMRRAQLLNAQKLYDKNGYVVYCVNGATSDEESNSKLSAR